MKGQENFNIPTGYIKMIEHKGGEYDLTSDSVIGGEVIDKFEIKNLIVKNASKYMATRMAPSSTPGVVYGDNRDGEYIFINGNTAGNGIRFLAVGQGAGSGTLQDPEAENADATQLRDEFARKAFTNWSFLKADGTISSTPTNVLLLSTTFTELEAVGPIVEMGLFGGDDASTTENSGQMFNYKTLKVWNKSSDSRLTIVWKLTF